MLGFGFGELVVVGVIGLLMLGGVGAAFFLIVMSQKPSQKNPKP